MEKMENTCPTCTFSNPSKSNRCEMCGLFFQDQSNPPIDLIDQIDPKFSQTFSSNCLTNGLIEEITGTLDLELSSNISITGECLWSYEICSPCPHITQLGFEGATWSCGYRNIQMLCASLIQIPQYRDVMFSRDGNIPDLLGMQAWIEKAWADGFDPEGCLEFGGTLVGSDSWIGPTEAASLLRYFGLRACIVDFSKRKREREGTFWTSSGKSSRSKKSKPKVREKEEECSGLQGEVEGGSSSSYPAHAMLDEGVVMGDALLGWVQRYFRTRGSDRARGKVKESERAVETKASSSSHSPFICIDVDEEPLPTPITPPPPTEGIEPLNYIPPLFFQHQGHSRTIIGYQIPAPHTLPSQPSRIKPSLLIFDPASNGKKILSSLQSNRPPSNPSPSPLSPSNSDLDSPSSPPNNPTCPSPSPYPSSSASSSSHQSLSSSASSDLEEVFEVQDEDSVSPVSVPRGTRSRPVPPDSTPWWIAKKLPTPTPSSSSRSRKSRAGSGVEAGAEQGVGVCSQWKRMVKRGLHTLTRGDYQVLFVGRGLMSPEERERSKTIVGMGWTDIIQFDHVPDSIPFLPHSP